MTNQMNFYDWEIDLNGGSFSDLSDLAQGDFGLIFNLFGGIDHINDCPSNDFRLNTILNEDVQSADEAFSIFFELINLFNGATALFSFVQKPIAARSFYHHNKNIRTPESHINHGCQISGEMIDRHKEHLTSSDEAADIRIKLICIALRDEDLNTILKFLTEKHSWVSLSRLADTIRTLSSRNNISLDRDPSKESAFGNMGNNFANTGLSSRHGLSQQTTKKVGPQMTLEEAHSYISGLAKQYISKMHNLSIPAIHFHPEYDFSGF